MPPPDYFVTYMSRQRARFVRNAVGARCMTSLLNVWAKPGISPDLLRPIVADPANAQLLREFGRTYGGGLGKIEPGDLVRLPVRPIEGIDEQARLVPGSPEGRTSLLGPANRRIPGAVTGLHDVTALLLRWQTPASSVVRS